MKYHRTTSQERDQILGLIISGCLSYPAIAERFDVSVSTVQYIASKARFFRGKGPLSPAHPHHKAKETR